MSFPCQIGVAVGSLALIAIFIVSSGGSDLVQSTQRSPAAADQAGSTSQLGEEARRDLQAQAARFEERLTGAADDLEALEVHHCHDARSAKPSGGVLVLNAGVHPSFLLDCC